MKKLLVPFFIACLVGCASLNTTTFKTLSAVEITTETTYNAYLSQVISGTVPTNNVPKISADFRSFQALMRVTVAAASGNTNSPAPLSVQNASGDLINKITAATAQGK